MSAPTVACVMLANGRSDMVARAVKSFRAQAYENKHLLVFDTGTQSIFTDAIFTHNPIGKIVHMHRPKGPQAIGSLRNEANDIVRSADIICHWDSDDWSHPDRIAEQVALLQSSGAECVGYNEMLFWQESAIFSSAWIYHAAIPNYAIGTSMCYWRETWQRNQFPDRSEGCDDLDWFNRGVKIASVSAFQNDECMLKEPRMVASIHGGNTCAKIAAQHREWNRVPIADGHCREVMKL